MSRQNEKKGRPHAPTRGRPAKHSIHNRSKRRVFWVASLFVLAGLIGYASYNWLDEATADGRPVPPITLETLNGEYVLGDPPGRAAVLFFSFPG